MKDKDSIHCLFDELNKALQIAQKDSKAKGRKSPVAVAKALHLLAPNFFPIWDGKIAAAYGYSSGKTAVENYIIFCEKIKRVAKNVCDGIQRKDKPLLKFIDEYNYAKYTKKWIK